MKWQHKDKADSSYKDKTLKTTGKLKHKPTLVKVGRLLDEEPKENTPEKTEYPFTLSNFY